MLRPFSIRLPNFRNKIYPSYKEWGRITRRLSRNVNEPSFQCAQIGPFLQFLGNKLSGKSTKLKYFGVFLGYFL